jgi:hypothetical protein
MRIKAINGLWHNFLGTYTSRYSDYDGYWLFGWLVNDVDELTIDLLSRDPDWVGSGPRVAAIRRALLTFHEQMEKAALDVSCAREARLDITKLPESWSGFVYGRARADYYFRFVATVVSQRGKTYQRQQVVFVAPHDPTVELRSAQ